MESLSPLTGPPRRWYLLFGVLLLIGTAATASAFVTDPGSAAPEPVAYDDVVELGVSTESDAVMDGDATIPRTQVFYSQLQYVVGYNGVEAFVAALADDRTDEQFGYPIAAYVETFDDADPTVTDDGYFRADGPTAWTDAERAVYVVDGDARTPSGETAIAFADPDAAATFAERHDGTVVEWEAVRTRSFDVNTAATVRSMATDRWDHADARLQAAADTADRPVSVVVGEDEPTIQAAVDAAPPNTTVAVPPGEYEETVEITKPITLAGTDAHVSGDGNGSVVTVRAPNVGITGLSIDGVGNETRDADAVEGPPDDGDGAWDTNVQLGYGHGDAGIRGIDASGLYVEDVVVETNASGLLLREGSDAAVRSLHVRGADDWQDGFMGIVAMESTVTVTDSRFEDGRDGVYAHRADDSVIRNSTFTGNRYGIHLMFTGDALLADNVVRDAEYGGITVMTRPQGNAVVGNDLAGLPAGIQASGTRTYVGYNTLSDNDLGLSTSSRRSLYEHNVMVGNEQGARATTVVPSSDVTRNDFVANDRHAGAGSGALRIWGGNYWDGAAVGFHDAGERPYQPTSALDGARHHDPAVVAVGHSPAMTLLDRLRGTVPGARAGAIIDPHPEAEPFHPDRVADANDPNREPIHPDWRTSISQTMNDTDAATTGGDAEEEQGDGRAEQRDAGVDDGGMVS